MATISTTPLNEKDLSIHIARMALPTFFPNGMASFHYARIHSVITLSEYNKHLIYYKDERFTRHPQSGIGPNSQMRQQAATVGRYFISISKDKMVDVETLREIAKVYDKYFGDLISRKDAILVVPVPIGYWYHNNGEPLGKNGLCALQAA